MPLPRVKHILLEIQHIQERQQQVVQTGYSPYFIENCFDIEVDYLVTEYNQTVLLGHDFAVQGSKVKDIESQVRDAFLPYAGTKPSWSPWTADNALFSTTPLLKCLKTNLFSHLDWN